MVEEKQGIHILYVDITNNFKYYIRSKKKKICIDFYFNKIFEIRNCILYIYKVI